MILSWLMWLTEIIQFIVLNPWTVLRINGALDNLQRRRRLQLLGNRLRLQSSLVRFCWPRYYHDLLRQLTRPAHKMSHPSWRHLFNRRRWRFDRGHLKANVTSSATIYNRSSILFKSISMLGTFCVLWWYWRLFLAILQSYRSIVQRTDHLYSSIHVIHYYRPITIAEEAALINKLAVIVNRFAERDAEEGESKREDCHLGILLPRRTSSSWSFNSTTFTDSMKLSRL